MISSDDQLKQFVDGIFFKHASTTNYLTLSQLYEFFCNFLPNNKVSLKDVQQTLLMVKTESSEKISKGEMYNILKILVGRKREEGLRERRDNGKGRGESMGQFGKKEERGKTRPGKENLGEKRVEKQSQKQDVNKGNYPSNIQNQNPGKLI